MLLTHFGLTRIRIRGRIPHFPAYTLLFKTGLSTQPDPEIFLNANQAGPLVQIPDPSPRFNDLDAEITAR
jgi:hypothetical protein